jgi:glucosyl-3-phosphoglycerate synthase
MTPQRRDLSVASWLDTRTYRASDYSTDRVLGAKDASVTVLLPAREVASTIGPLLEILVAQRELGLIDELCVIDADSADGTARVAARKGATVLQRSEVLCRYGPARGKGDAIWRGLYSTSGDIVVVMDTDTENFGPHFLLGLLGPLLEDDDLHFVKGSFHRPLLLGGAKLPDEGGRVTELVARPLLNLYVPQLAGFVQPLAGEVAARRDLLESMPIPVGYGVEAAMLIDALRSVGIEGLGQVDLGSREDRPQRLRSLSRMAYAVAATIMARVEDGDLPVGGRLLQPLPEGLEEHDVALEERPPIASIDEEDAAGM